LDKMGLLKQEMFFMLEKMKKRLRLLQLNEINYRENRVLEHKSILH